MILRVFPHRTRATPNDDWVRIGFPTLYDPPTGTTEIHLSGTFTWDIPLLWKMLQHWRAWTPLPVKIGGPAYGDKGDEFRPGWYLAEGNVITSRGCPNRCDFCFVPKREGALRELPIRDGWLVHDNNLLACSRKHIEAVFEMLAGQPFRARFVGGLEAARVEIWHARAMKAIHTRRIYLAYDRPRVWRALQDAVAILKNVCELYCYVLIGYEGDTREAAASRCDQVLDAGMMPYAMLYRDEDGRIQSQEWRKLQREWCRPAIIRSKLKHKSEQTGAR